MIKRFKGVSIIAVLLFATLGLLVACSDSADMSGEESKAKTGDEATPKGDTDNGEKEKEETDDDSGDSGDKSDPWTYYEDATWEGDFNGLKTEIQKVAVTEEAPTVEDENAKKSAVGVRFKIENTTEDKMFETFPDQATLVTSTGEQVEADMWLSDDLGGEIHEGVIKEGGVYFYLERGEALEVDWVKLAWSAYDPQLEDEGNYDDSTKNFEVKLELK